MKIVKSKYTGLTYEVFEEIFSEYTKKSYYLIENTSSIGTFFEWWEANRFTVIQDDNSIAACQKKMEKILKESECDKNGKH